MGQRRAQEGAESRRAPRERAAPPRHRRAGQRPAPGAPAKDLPRLALRGSTDEDLLEDFAPHFHRVVRARLLESRQDRKRRVGRLLALVAWHTDVLGHGVEKAEIAEVVAVFRKAAVGAAPQAVGWARKIESPLSRQMKGEFRIGLEWRALRAYGDRSFRSGARAKMRQHDRSGAFSLDRRWTTVLEPLWVINRDFRLGLSQPI